MKHQEAIGKRWRLDRDVPVGYPGEDSTVHHDWVARAGLNRP